MNISSIGSSAWVDTSRYKHGVLSDLFIPTLLRTVRSEIQANISFTPKETDIYRIDQSGDLANLDGLDKDTLRRLPSVQTLRDALYSLSFREYLSAVTSAGPLSGVKMDMAINVYTPGCHLLCHDDVIGSRKVSYILYLTDPDKPWKEEWGGALRLYPTQILSTDDGKSVKISIPDHSVSIPPAFNQLSFFAVQPGESFHDVEEVYAETESADEGPHCGRVRMAISGWYHIPQRGEDGFVEGLEDELAKKSSLMQLQGKLDRYDLPSANFQQYALDTPDGVEIGLPTPSSQDDAELTKEDLDFLLKYMNPHYLTPDTLESVTEIFAEESFLLLDTFLSHKFSDKLRTWIKFQEESILPTTSKEIELETGWKMAQPPHKHRYLYQQPSDVPKDLDLTPMQDLLKNLVPSKAFQRWLQIATGLTLKTNNPVVRRFRRGHDYTLAQRYDETVPGLEICLSLTPTKGWGDDQIEDEPAIEQKAASTVKDAPNEMSTANAPEVGGYLAYMAGDDDDHEHSDAGDNHGVEVLLDMSTGGRATKAKKPKMDPAIYQAQRDDEEDPILFHMSATWNQLGIVLRDKGTMRFVKYVSRQAKGDRWDLVSDFEIEDPTESDDGNEGVDLRNENATDSDEKNDDDVHDNHECEDSDESSEP